MSEPYLGQITMVAFNFAPRGYAECDGQIVQISQNQSLFSLLGTTYGGDGRTSFALPDLRGRTPVHFGNGTGVPPYSLGQRGGTEAVALSTGQMPAHRHGLRASNDAPSSDSPDGTLPARTEAAAYSTASGASTVAMAPGAIGSNAGGQPHANMQPFLTITFCIAVQGVFPSRN